MIMLKLVPEWANHYDEFWAAIRKRNLWFIQLRYIFFIILLLFVFVGEYFLSFQFTDLQFRAILLTATYILLYNIIIHSSRKHVGCEPGKFNCMYLSLIQSVLDISALFVLIYYTGIIESPLYMLFIFQTVIGSMILPGVVVYTITTTTCVIFIVMVFLQHFDYLHSHLIVGLTPIMMEHTFTYDILIVTVFSFIMLCSVYLANTISRRLYKREQQLRDYIIKIDEAEITKQRYIMGVVHEIKSPINAVQSILDLVINKYLGPISTEIEEKLRRAKSRTEESLQLINNVLHISKLKLLDVSKNEEIALSKIMHNLLDKNYETASIKNITIKLSDKRKRKKIISADKTLLDLAFSNIIGNSVKYGRQDGTILIELNDPTPDSVQISVHDDGIGIPTLEVTTVFEEFYRASNAKKKSYEGSGLGLSLVKEIIEKQKGRIELHSPSKLGSEQFPGTTVTITLPTIELRE